MIATAWDISALTIVRLWHNLFDSGHGASHPCLQNSEMSQPMPTVQSDHQLTCEMLVHDLDSKLTDEDIRSWLNSDSSDHGYQLLSDDDIVSNITTPNQNKVSSEEKEEDTDTQVTPTCAAVVDMLNKCIVNNWYK